MESQDFNVAVGQTVRRLRKAKGFTQEDFASRTGMSRGTIANIETGRQAASGYQIYHLASVLRLEEINQIFPLLPVEEDEGDYTEDIEIFSREDLSDEHHQQALAVLRQVRAS